MGLCLVSAFFVCALKGKEKLTSEILFTGCIDPALTIAASMSSRSVFASSFEDREEADKKRGVFSPEGSDHLAGLRAFDKWRELRAKGERKASDFIRSNFLSRLSLFQVEDLRKQYSRLLADIGFLPKGFRVGGKGKAAAVSTPLDGPNRNAENISMLKAVLCAGLYPNIIVAPRALVDGSAAQQACEYTFNGLKGDVHLHPCTLSSGLKQLESRYGCYHEIVKTSKTYVRDLTAASPFALLLFGGKLVVHHARGVVTIDDWLKFRIAPASATLVKHLRSQMERALLEKIVNPELALSDIPAAQALIEAVNTVLDTEAGQTIQTRNDGAEIVRPYIPSERSTGRTGRGGRGSRRPPHSGRYNGGSGRQNGGRGRGRMNPNAVSWQPSG